MDKTTPTDLECIESPRNCGGDVEMRPNLYAMRHGTLGKGFPRCEKHWQASIERDQQIVDKGYEEASEGEYADEI